MNVTAEQLIKEQEEGCEMALSETEIKAICERHQQDWNEFQREMYSDGKNQWSAANLASWLGY